MATKNKKKKSAAKKTAKKAGPKKAKVTRLKRKPTAKVATTKSTATTPSNGSGKVISISQARATKTSAPKIDWANFFTPIDDRVLLETVKPEERTAGGLYIPDSVQTKSNSARVLAVGPGKRDKKGHRRPLDVRIGEKVLYAEYAGSQLQLEGRDLLLLNETDILGVVE